MVEVAAGPGGSSSIGSSEPALPPSRGLPPLALAGIASLGAGAIHAAAIGVHSEHRQAVYAFTAAAAIQLGWGAVALVRSSRLVALVGAGANAAMVGGWLLAKSTGIAFIDGLTDAESVQAADALAAGLATVAVLIAIAVAASPSIQPRRLNVQWGIVAMVIAALTVPAMASTGGHSHSGGHGDSAAHAHTGTEVASGVEAHHHESQEDANATSPAPAHDDHEMSAEVGDHRQSAASGVVHDHGPAIAITATELEGAARLVSDTTEGVERFNDLEAAKADGYYQVAPPRNRLVHYMNSAYNRDGRILDPERPESLIYLNLSDGSWMLVGAMYRMPAPDQPGPRVGGPLTAWHAHNNLCQAEGRVVGVAVDGVCARGSLSNTPEMLHVWLVDNPDGVFSDDMEPTGLLQPVQN